MFDQRDQRVPRYRESSIRQPAAQLPVAELFARTELLKSFDGPSDIYIARLMHVAGSRGGVECAGSETGKLIEL